MKSYLVNVPHSASMMDKVEVNLTFPSFTSVGATQVQTSVSLALGKEFCLLDKWVGPMTGQDVVEK
jgi:hypothetical protein